MRVLLVKMSSLGDVVHALPAVSDLAANGAQIDWVVEEAFVPIAAAHAQVRQVLPIAWRRWRKALPAFWQPAAAQARAGLGDFRRTLRSTRYDLVIDAQGLLKSAMVVAQAQAQRKVGLDRASAREPLAARFYSQSVAVARGQHAVDRVRQLCAAAAGYTIPEHCDFGLPAAQPALAQKPVCLLLHGTTWASKHYPESHWAELVGTVAAAGYEPAVTWGDAAEQQRAERLQQAGATVWPRASLTDLIERLRSVALVIGVDSGIAHLAGAMQIPTLGLYGATNATLTGVRGACTHNLQTNFACSPCVQRQCAYTGPAQHHAGAVVTPSCFGTLPPATVWRSAQQLLAG
ncbi:MAG: lipopolysaccharide heptosyltransferase I [Pseudomonadales bacterium]